MNTAQRGCPRVTCFLSLGVLLVALAGRGASAGEHPTEHPTAPKTEPKTEPPEEGHQHDEGGTSTEGTDFDSYSAAVAAIDKHRAHVAELIEHKKLSELHQAAKPIQQIAEKLVGLALKEDSGVPGDSIKEVSRTARALANTWAKIDAAGDAGNLAASKKVYDEIVGLVNTLKKFATPVEGAHQEESNKPDAQGDEAPAHEGEEGHGH